MVRLLHNDGRSTHCKVNCNMLCSSGRIKDYENSIFKENNSAMFGEHSQCDLTCTYQSERHFCGYFKTQGADMSSIISPCFHQKLVQLAPGTASFLQTKGHGAFKLHVFLKSYPQD